jgi:hypothetical protein
LYSMESSPPNITSDLLDSEVLPIFYYYIQEYMHGPMWPCPS